MKTTFAYKIASTIEALKNSEKRKNDEGASKHADRLFTYEQALPSGSGIDSGCKIDSIRSSSEKIIINTSFHHLNEDGYYDGWTDHTVTVTPSFWERGLNIKISGRDRNQIKYYLHDVFYNCLTSEMEF